MVDRVDGRVGGPIAGRVGEMLAASVAKMQVVLQEHTSRFTKGGASDAADTGGVHSDLFMTAVVLRPHTKKPLTPPPPSLPPLARTV